MALTRYVLTQTVTVTPSGTVTPGSFGGETIAPVSTDQWQPLYPAVFLKGTALYADPGAVTGAGTGAQELYQILNAGGFLRAWVQGQDDVGHAALSN